MFAAGKHSHEQHFIVQLCPASQGKARQGKRKALLCLTLPKRDLARRSSSALPCFPVSMAYGVPMVGKQIRAVVFGKEVIKGTDNHKRLAASRSLFGLMPDAPERHYNARLCS